MRFTVRMIFTLIFITSCVPIGATWMIFIFPLSGLFSFIAGDGFCYRELCKEALEAFKHSLSVIWSSPSLKRSEKKGI